MFRQIKSQINYANYAIAKLKQFLLFDVQTYIQTEGSRIFKSSLVPLAARSEA
jgi:hypothetical protein